MYNSKTRDVISVEDENGIEMQFSVEALLTMEECTYALLRAKNDLTNAILMQVENEDDGQYLVGIDDPQKTKLLLDAYEIAVDANPAD
ncbi:hypothetical protein WQ54_00660 [Bacillus sp. SA1-12]|uniref:DUF1292 domain-containing protein n=1 Tax=Bacillus sp. SA1-12 TaxID=1455638 RepID=UPI00062502FC|nr:DUF1292 domain-containing protein [Bacillus sp. SA1-12]KKI94084.1 hypothetical protein WQ54_00660 [Bacillus sp. SA1-12]